MARQFTMGARLTMADMFTNPISAARRSTEAFRATITNTNTAIGNMTRSQQRARSSHAQYTSQGNHATAATRTWITANGKLGASFSWIQRGLAGAAAAFGLYKAKGFFVDSNADMETYRNTLAVVLKDEKKAVETLDWATKFAAATPFEIPQIVEATTRMSAYGINAQKTMGIVGDMAAVMGKDLMQAVEAVADAQTGEVERLKEFGITKKMIEDQAKLMKLTVTNKQGTITDQKAFNAVLFTIMENRFKGGMERQSKTFKGMISNAKDFMGSLGRSFGAPIFERLKKGLSNVMDWANKLQNSGAIQAWADKVGPAIDKAMYYLDALRWLAGLVFTRQFAEHKEAVNKLRAVFDKVFDKGSETLTWIKDIGLPRFIELLGNATGFALDLYNMLDNNWNNIAPIVWGIVGAMVAYEAITLAVVVAQKAALIISAVTKAWQIATGAVALLQAGLSIATVAQWAFNVAMTANPIGIIIVAIGVLVAAIVWLVYNWEWVKATVVKVWQTIYGWIQQTPDWLLWIVAPILLVVKHFDQIKEVAGIVWEAVKEAFVKIKDKLFEFGNSVMETWQNVKDFLKNPIKGVVDLFRNNKGDNTTAIPGHKTGLNFVPYDNYVACLHKGERVLTAEENRQYSIGETVNPAGNVSSTTNSSSNRVVIEKLVDKIVIEGAGQDADTIVEKVVDKLHDLLKQAQELSSGSMEVLLNG